MERGNWEEVRPAYGAEADNSRTGRSPVHQTVLLLAAATLWALLFTAFAALGGCSCPDRPVVSSPASPGPFVSYKNVRFVPVLVQADNARPSLIFPAEPDLTPVPGEAFSRADWPTTPGRFDAGQSVNYQEYWYDSQSLTPYSPSYGYRTFMIQRNGLQVGP